MNPKVHHNNLSDSYSYQSSSYSCFLKRSFFYAFASKNDTALLLSDIYEISTTERNFLNTLPSPKKRKKKKKLTTRFEGPNISFPGATKCPTTTRTEGRLKRNRRKWGGV